MVRNRSRKSTIGLVEPNVMFEAVKSVLHGGLSTKASASQHSIARTTLTRYVKKCKNLEIDWEHASLETVPRLNPHYDIRRIFSDQQELVLCDYLQMCAKLHHGMPPKAARSLAYDLAVTNNIQVPASWSRNKMAGEDWLTAFLKRNPRISIRTAESTSIARAMGFNKPVVSGFFEKYEHLLQRYQFGPERIYNTDETSLTTVQNPIRVLASKGQKQVGQITSAERGTLVTMCGTINALGNSIPPLLIFPRVHYKEFMIKGAPYGTLGAATPSGWISSEVFLKYLQHFVKYASPTNENPVLLIMDNHDSHISLSAINYAKQNNVILFTFPPHTTHRLQPLDRCIYGPLKKYYNDACRSWLLHNPGKRITIYDIPEILGNVYHVAFSTSNIVSAFRKTGLYPFNRNIFDDSEFLAATVTDTASPEASAGSLTLTVTDNADCMPGPSNSVMPVHVRPTTPSNQFIPPHIIQPYPKAERTEKIRKARRKRSSQILTDTPVRDELAEIENSKVTREKKKTVKRNLSKPKIIKKVELNETSSDSASTCELAETTDSENNMSVEGDETKTCGEIENDGFVLVKFATKKQIKYYVGQVKEILPEELIVTFLRRSKDKFCYPTVEDVATVDKSDVELVLPEPQNTGGTARMSSFLKFSIDFESYNIC